MDTPARLLLLQLPHSVAAVTSRNLLSHRQRCCSISLLLLLPMPSATSPFAEVAGGVASLLHDVACCGLPQ